MTDRGATRRLALVGIGVVIVIATALLWPRLGGGSDGSSLVRPAAVRRPDLVFVVPPGTADALRQGESVDIIPNPLQVRVGQTVRIRNLDDASQVVGPFFVRAHETVTQRFVAPGRLSGTCALHPSGQLEIVIRP